MIRKGTGTNQPPTAPERGPQRLGVGVLAALTATLLLLSAASTVLGAKPPTTPPQALAVTGLATNAAGTVQTIRVTAQTNGKVNPAYRGAIVLTSSDGAAVLPARYTFTAADKGVRTFSVQLKTAGSQTVTATDTANAAIKGSQSVTVTGAAAAAFSLSGLSGGVAGQAQNLTLTVRDAYGNLATGYRGRVQGQSSDTQAAVPASYTFTAADAGVHTFSVALKTVGQQSIGYTDAPNAALTATAGPVTVTPAGAAKLVLGRLHSDAAGSVQSVSVTALDAYDNVATGYRGTVSFGSSDAQAKLPADYAFTAGEAGFRDFNVTLKTVGAHTVTVTDTQNATLTSTQSATTSNGPAADIVLTTDVAESFQDQPLVTAGQPFALTARVVDAFGNTAVDFVGKIGIRTTEPGGLGEPLTVNYQYGPADAGSRTIANTELRVKRIYNQHATITATMDGNAAVTNSLDIQVLPGPAVRYSACPSAYSLSSSYSQVNNPIGVNDPIGFTFQALDAYGNNATNQVPILGDQLPGGYQSQAPVTTTDPQADFSSQGAIARFEANPLTTQGPTIQVRFRTAGDHTFTVTDPYNPALTITCSIRVRGPIAVIGTYTLLDPKATGNTRVSLSLTRYLPPNDSGYVIETFVGPTSGGIPVGTVQPEVLNDAGLNVLWDLDPAAPSGPVLRCTTQTGCPYSALTFTFRIRDAFGNTSDGSIVVTPWTVSLPAGTILHFDGKIGTTATGELPLDTTLTGIVIGTRPGSASVKVGNTVVTVAMPTDSNLTTGMNVDLKMTRPLVVGGTTPDCVPDVGKVCEVASFVDVTLIGYDDPSTADDPALTGHQTMGTDMCGFFSDEMTACPSVLFHIGNPPAGSGLPAGSGFPPVAHIGFQYHFQFLASSNIPEPIEFTLVNGTHLPPGLTLSPSGLISGTPTTATLISFAVQATGITSGASITEIFTIVGSALTPN